MKRFARPLLTICSLPGIMPLLLHASLGAQLYVAQAPETKPKETQDYSKLYEDAVAEYMKPKESRDLKKVQNLFERAFVNAPEGPSKRTAANNVACAIALQGGSKDLAFDWLKKATDEGYGVGRDTNGNTEVAAAESDTDLDSLRGDKRFVAFLAKVRENAAPVIYAPSEGKRLPVLLLLHPEGSNKRKVLNDGWKSLAKQLSIRIVAISGAIETQSGQQPVRWQWFEGQPSIGLDEPRLAGIDKLLSDAVDTLKKENSLEPNEIYLGGALQGATVALAASLRNPKTFRGALIVDPHLDQKTIEGLNTKNLPPAFRVFHIGSTERQDLKKQLDAAKVNYRSATYRTTPKFPEDAQDKVLAALKFLLSGENAPK